MVRAALVLEDLRVQKINRADGSWSYSILWPDYTADEEAESYLRVYEGSGSQQTYAYYLVDHLRWRIREGLTTETITLQDLQRYQGAVGARVPMPYGQPWRVPPKRPYSTAGLSVSATVLKRFYLHQCVRLGINHELRESLDVSRLPTQADRTRAVLGHVMTSMPSNPLAPPSGKRRRHPKMLPDGSRSDLMEVVNTARDEMVVTWLSDSTLRIGGLTGLHLVDLHLREHAGCGECVSPHLHVCHRHNNPNRARAKKKEDWKVVDGVITGGEIYRVSPAMISSYFKYMTTEYAQHATGHGMLLIQLSGPSTGEPWTADAARGMLRRAGKRARLPGRIKPHAFRHTATSKILALAKGDPSVAKAAGNWASAAMVDEVYGHPDLHSPDFSAALTAVWQENE
ncbi:tyrosine-type recombinase/integrase [Streptomyces sp. NBC_01363]|uniref:tyrosine-type recombinase/integrase n=1 Tax=Streptomyces sp. NBC_01363 TaxID=2903840 RepID=UPI00225A71BA|nr:tyrosine-type recombinase/integrase [Streptomyces sp. NBC_01363]MCX4735071.1 tyrosine-type recombinase/integrase [Streptomyces sp. NBC_01363]